MNTNEFFVALETRKSTVEDRSDLDSITYSSTLPSFLLEKLEELKVIVRLGFDNYALKMMILYLEEVLIHILISEEIDTEQDYIPALIELDKKYKYGWQVLNQLKEKELISEENYQHCSKYFHDEKHGGERIRNIEIHNLIADKISGFQIRDDVKEKLDDFSVDFLTNTIKQKAFFVHIGARDMVSRSIVTEYNYLVKLINDSTGQLERLNHLKDKASEDIVSSLPLGNSFKVMITHNSIEFGLITNDLCRVGNVQRIERVVVDKKKDNYIVHLKTTMSSLDFMMMINRVKSLDYIIGDVGIFHN